MPNNTRLLDYLPAIYQQDKFLGDFLAAFEKVLLGRPDGGTIPTEGLEETINNLADKFDPRNTPDEFLEWLAGWTALSLRADLSITQQRNFIANTISRYQQRGTKQNLQELLKLFVNGIPTITEPSNDNSEPEQPHFFVVTISLPRLPPEVQARQMEIARSLIDMEKPAHTNYELNINTPSMQIGVFSTIGVDTLLGNIPINTNENNL